ncbi:MAG TPA: FkbM family methyltransferase [Syntrophorhabdales bacterium]|nr:FkbM family methyltransferase [Syntrophorhabdales bacterium]
MLGRKGLRLLLSYLPPEWKGRLRTHLGGPDLRWSLRQLARFGFAPKTVTDVGAFHGDWTRICLEIFPKAEITCVEPQEEAKFILSELTSAYTNVRAIQILLGKEVSNSIPFTEEGPGSSVLGNGLKRSRRSMTTLDNLIETGVSKPPQLLKLDVQGYETEILKGYTKYFHSCEVIQCELSLLPLLTDAPLLDEVVSYLRQRDFVMFDIEEIIQAPSDGAVWQIDALFCRKDSPLRTERMWRR